jgi:hypothetical protein
MVVVIIISGPPWHRRSVHDNDGNRRLRVRWCVVVVVIITSGPLRHRESMHDDDGSRHLRACWCMVLGLFVLVFRLKTLGLFFFVLADGIHPAV